MILRKDQWGRWRFEFEEYDRRAKKLLKQEMRDELIGHWDLRRSEELILIEKGLKLIEEGLYNIEINGGDDYIYVFLKSDMKELKSFSMSYEDAYLLKF